MARGQWALVLQHVRRLVDGGSISGLTDGQLLDRFVASRDEGAFGAIVALHGPMVLGVCRGVLGDPHDVEDAFQATFLVLVRKAGSLRHRERLGQWLYGVARRVALRSRSEARRRRAKARPGVEVGVATLDAGLWELQALVREEVDRLPGNDRMAVVLCYLEGLTHEEAAERLGWPVGTVKGRLSRARDKLRGRLARRGIALPAVVIASTVDRAAKAAVPLGLIRSTTLAAIRLAGGQTLTAGIISAQAIALMEGVLVPMIPTNLKIGAALAATCALAIPGVVAYQAATGPTTPQAPAQASTSMHVPRRVVAPGELLDEATTAEESLDRDGSIPIAESALRHIDAALDRGPEPAAASKLYLWSRRLVEAQSGPGIPKGTRKAALRAHYDRMLKLHQKARPLSGKGTDPAEAYEFEYQLAEAKRWLRAGRIEGEVEKQATDFATGGLPNGLAANGAGGFAPGMMGGGGGLGGGRAARGSLKMLALNQTPADEGRNEQIRLKLEAKVPMKFATETPLEEVVKLIEDSTRDEKGGFPSGIPIYIDPNGLTTAEATLASTVRINIEGVPLRTTLRLILRQLGLDFRIDGGVLLISDQGSIMIQEMRANRDGPASR